MALNDYELKMPNSRSNKKMQPRGQAVCGQFVCHWTETKIREIFGEGSSSIGHPHIVRINTRIQKMQNQIVQNKGFAKIHEAKLAKCKEKIQQAKDKETMALNKLAQDKEFLELSLIHI